MPAHPTFPNGWHAQHESIIRHVPSNHSARPNKGIAADAGATNDGCIGPDCRSPANSGSLIEMATYNLGSRIHHIGEHTGGAAENIIFKLNTRINGNIVLNFDVVTNGGIRGDENILAKDAVLSNSSVGTD